MVDVGQLYQLRAAISGDLANVFSELDVEVKNALRHVSTNLEAADRGTRSPQELAQAVFDGYDLAVAEMETLLSNRLESWCRVADAKASAFDWQELRTRSEAAGSPMSLPAALTPEPQRYAMMMEPVERGSTRVSSRQLNRQKLRSAVVGGLGGAVVGAAIGAFLPWARPIPILLTLALGGSIGAGAGWALGRAGRSSRLPNELVSELRQFEADFELRLRQRLNELHKSVDQDVKQAFEAVEDLMR